MGIFWMLVGIGWLFVIGAMVRDLNRSYPDHKHTWYEDVICYEPFSFLTVILGVLFCWGLYTICTQPLYISWLDFLMSVAWVGVLLGAPLSAYWVGRHIFKAILPKRLSPRRVRSLRNSIRSVKCWRTLYRRPGLRRWGCYARHMVPVILIAVSLTASVLVFNRLHYIYIVKPGIQWARNVQNRLSTERGAYLERRATQRRLEQEQGYLVYAERGREITYVDYDNRLQSVTLGCLPTQRTVYLHDVGVRAGAQQAFRTIRGNDLSAPEIVTYTPL